MTASLARPLLLALLLAVPAAGAAVAEDRPSMAQMDADGNGTVTVDEADAFFVKHRGEGHGKGGHGKRPEGHGLDGKGPAGKRPDGKGHPGGKPPKGQLPADRDGRGQPPGGKDADANGDGEISKGEFDALMKRHPAPPAE